jgi:hypothetical protein
VEHFDLDAAVRAGVLRSDQADALRRFDEELRHAPGASEERFALVSGFSDIMAAVGIGMLAWAAVVVQVIAMGMGMGVGAGVGLVFPLFCWWGATFFTVKRRMMLTSIVLFAGFALSSALTGLSVALWVVGKSPASVSVTAAAISWAIMVAFICTCACWLYWRRFRLPIAYCAFAVAAVNVGMDIIRLLAPDMPGWGVDLVSAAIGPILFLWAMWWDISDVRRETERSAVAFWLHIAAGFATVKSAMTLLLGHADSSDGWWRLFSDPAAPSGTDAVLVLGLVAAFAVVSLIIDRRSLLTSAMAYAIPALIALIGGGALMFAPALLLCGILLVVLAVQWLPFRVRLLRLLPPGMVAQLPRPQLKAVGPRPVF